MVARTIETVDKESFPVTRNAAKPMIPVSTPNHPSVGT
jgi:hypothetical protein